MEYFGTQHLTFNRLNWHKFLPHVQPLPEVRSYQAGQCYQGDHGLQWDQRVQLYQALPMVGSKEKHKLYENISY